MFASVMYKPTNLYQLNKYNKAWLNTNLSKFSLNTDFIYRKVPGICLKRSEKRIASIHENFVPSPAFILFSCKNLSFYTKRDFSRA